MPKQFTEEEQAQYERIKAHVAAMTVDQLAEFLLSRGLEVRITLRKDPHEDSNTNRQMEVTYVDLNEEVPNYSIFYKGTTFELMTVDVTDGLRRLAESLDMPSPTRPEA